MYVSIRRYKTNPAVVEELMKRVELDFVPQVRALSGFVAYYGVNAGDGVVAFVNFFDNRGSAEESNNIAARWVKEDAADLFPIPADITAGAVIVHSTAEKQP